MKKKGRPAKPDELKKLQGTDRPDRLNNDQPVFEEVRSADPPEDLSPEEKRIWSDLVPQFIEAKIYTSIDIQAVCMLCAELAEYWELHKITRRLASKKGKKIFINGNGYKLKMLQQMKLNNANKLMSQFGMTPVARQNMRLTGGPDPGPVDPLQKALPSKPQINR